MRSRLVSIPPPTRGVYRLGRGHTEPFAPPDWNSACDDGTFGNRFDDPSTDEEKPPETRFRTIYCATQRIATFGETVARFRPSPALLANLDTIDDEESLAESLAGAVDPQDVSRGLIPADWRLRRRVDHTILDPGLLFVDIIAAETMQHLRTALASLAVHLHLADVDLSSVTSQQRRFTQGCARYIHEQRDTAGMPRYAGIRYVSRLNSQWECWAVFEDRLRHVQGWPGLPVAILADDEDLLSVATLFNLTIELFSGQQHYLRLPR